MKGMVIGMNLLGWISSGLIVALGLVLGCRWLWESRSLAGETSLGAKRLAGLQPEKTRGTENKVWSWLRSRWTGLFGGEGTVEPLPRRETVTVFFLALGFRVFSFLALVYCVLLTTPDGAQPNLVSAFDNWDGGQYIPLVEQGYDGFLVEGENLALVFFPLYVWITRLVTWIIPNTVVAGVLVSCFSFAWGATYLYRVGTRLFGREAGKTAVLLISCFPYGFSFGHMMTESLFLLTTCGCFYAILREKWGRAGLWGALAALTRMTGLLMVFAIGVALVQKYRPFSRSWGDTFRGLLPIVKRLPFALLPCLGTLVYLGLNYTIDGDPFAFLTHQKHWFQGYSWFGNTISYLWDYLLKNLTSSLGAAVWIPTLTLALVVFVLLCCAAFHPKLPGWLLLLGFATFVGNYSLSWLLSAPRYLSCAPALFLVAAALLAPHPRLRTGILLGSSILYGINLLGFVSGAHLL